MINMYQYIEYTLHIRYRIDLSWNITMHSEGLTGTDLYVLGHFIWLQTYSIHRDHQLPIPPQTSNY